MKAYSLIFITAAALLLPLHSFAQQDLHKQPIGTIVKSHFSVGKKNVFLPDGDWVLIGVSETDVRKTDGGVPWDIKWANLWLAQTQGKSLRALVRVEASLDAWQITRWTGASECDRTNVLFTKNLSKHVTGEFCNVINHYTNVLNGSFTGFHRQAFLWLERSVNEFPSTLIGIGFKLNAIPGNSLNIRYYFNPEFDGFSQSAKSSWSQNDWHKDFIARDAKKVAYIDGLKTWATAMQPAVAAGFEGKNLSLAAYAGWPRQKTEMQAAPDPF